MQRSLSRWILALGVVCSPPLAAQSAAPAAMGKLIPTSDVRHDWLDGGVESPSGRFYLLDSYASNDSGFIRYDRIKRSWAYLGRGNVGAHPRWSPNGRFVTFIRRAEDAGAWQVWLLPMDTATGLAGGPPRRVSTRPAFGPAAGPAAWSPDGRRIAFVTHDAGRMTIVAVPFNGGDEEVLFQAPGFLNSVVWSRDGRSIFVNHTPPDRTARTLRVSLDDKRSVDLGEAQAPIVDISPDGKWLAQWVFFRSQLFLLSTDGKSARTVQLSQAHARLVPTGWSHTNPGEIIALDHIVPTGVQRVSVSDGHIRTVMGFDSTSGPDGPALSPDGRQLAYVRHRDDGNQIIVSDTNGANARVLVQGGGSPTWSPNGRQIAYAKNGTDINIVDIGSKQTRQLLPAAAEACTSRPNLYCDGRVGNVEWRSDARALRYFARHATAGGHAVEMHEIDLEGRDRVVTTTTLSGHPAFVAGTDTMFLLQEQNALQVVNVRTGAAHVVYSGATRGLMSPLSTNGQWIFIVADSGGNGAPIIDKPILVSLTTGESKRLPYALGGEVSYGYFLPDGRNVLLIACTSCHEPDYKEKWDIIVAPMNGDPPRILTGSEAGFADFWPAGPTPVTPDGRAVFFGAEQSYNTRVARFTLPPMQ